MSDALDHLRPPPGFADISPRSLLRWRWIHHGWRSIAAINGYDLMSPAAAPEDADGNPARYELLRNMARMFAATETSGLTRWSAIARRQTDDRPQRSRAREFTQWGCCLYGEPSPRGDAEVIALAVQALRALGIGSDRVKVRISHRAAVESLLLRRGVPHDDLTTWFPLLHRAGKMSNDDFVTEAISLGMEAKVAVDVLRLLTMSTPFEQATTQLFLSEQAGGKGPEYFKSLFGHLRSMGVSEWCVLNLGIVRASSYYSGMVFEVHPSTGGDRSIAGGGRVDRVFDELGVASTSAVGFEMGDVALWNLVEEAGAFPTDLRLVTILGMRPEAFVVGIGSAAGETTSVAAMLRHSGIATRVTTASVADMAEAEAVAKSDIAAGTAGAWALRMVVLSHDGGSVVAQVRWLESGRDHPAKVPVAALPLLLKS